MIPDLHGPHCRNCFSPSVQILSEVDSAQESVITSDAQVLDEVRVRRLLCLDCACVSLQYEPADRLQRFFQRDYDLADTVQDHPVIVAGRRVGKHDRVAETLWNGLPDDLPLTGNWLEIACGHGALSARFQAEHPGWNCHALDPAPTACEALHRVAPRVRFTQDFFRVEHYPRLHFDLIAAHGFLNRSPVWPELVKMRRLSRPGTLLSLDLLVLEDSVFAPRIWDHSFMYLQPVLEDYLAAAGFAVRKVSDCVSSLHVLAECVGPGRRRPPRPGVDLVARTGRVLAAHDRWWDGVVEACRREMAENDRPTALYGAGLFNAVLLKDVASSNFTAVIDDTKAGQVFRGLPVISLEEAVRRRLRTLICCRSAYGDYLVARARRAGLEADVVGQEAAVCESSGSAAGHFSAATNS